MHVQALKVPPGSASVSVESPSESPIPTLDEILGADPDQFVAKYTDIAAINLACAVGLPHAEDLDIPKCLLRLDAMAAAVRLHLKKHSRLYDMKPAEFHDSRSVFQIFSMAHVLYKHFGVHYNPKTDRNNPSMADSRDQFIHGPIGSTKCGTCASLPLLALSVGRRLGYPLKLAILPRHLMFRWDDGKELINFEYTGQGAIVRPEEHYYKFPAEWTEKMHDERKRFGIWLTSLSARREVAVCLINRTAVLAAHSRFREELKIWEAVERYDPENIFCSRIKQEVMAEMGWQNHFSPAILDRIEPGREMLDIINPYRDRSKDPKHLNIRISTTPLKGEGIHTITITTREAAAKGRTTP